MNGLFSFIQRYLHWFLFIFLELVCMALLFTFNSFQGSVYFSAANVVSGRILEMKSDITAYFSLKEANESLAVQNAELQQRVDELEQALLVVQTDSVKSVYVNQMVERNAYEVYAASVIDNSITRSDNYITIDRGLSDGIVPDMGVVGIEGVIGVVYKCSQHYSLVMSILNSKSSVSCKVLGSDYFGYLNWPGGDTRYAVLNDLPRYSDVQIGDTIVTSGHSSFFPEGLMVGFVEGLTPSTDGLYVTLKVALSTDFANLRHSFILRKRNVDELEAFKVLSKANTE